MSTPSFENMRVLVLESRRAQELASLVTTYHGNPLVAPSMREVPLESNTEAVTCADALERGECDLLILLTGVGTRALADAVERVRGTREPLLEAMRRTRIAARGPKPVAVLREWGIPFWFMAPEPNTWRELVAAIDARATEMSLQGASVFVQEYGASNPELLSALESRGARVTRVPVYQWALPEDLEPLRWAVREIADRKVDVALFTTATQVIHLLQVAESMQMRQEVLAGLRRSVVASIGPTTSEELRAHGVSIDMEPSHPKMGFLVREAAERAATLREAKRRHE